MTVFSEIKENMFTVNKKIQKLNVQKLVKETKMEFLGLKTEISEKFTCLANGRPGIQLHLRWALKSMLLSSLLWIICVVRGEQWESLRKSLLKQWEKRRGILWKAPGSCSLRDERTVRRE